MTAYLAQAWCRVCAARTVQSHVAVTDPLTGRLLEFAVCAECGEQVG